VSRFYAWLERPFSTVQAWIAAVILWPAFKLAYAVFFLVLVAKSGIPIPDHEGAEFIKEELDRLWYLIIAMMFMVLGETIIYQAVPLIIARSLARRFNRPSLMLWVLLVVSVAFGWLHGGPLFILLQGVGGLAWGVLFLKSGGMAGEYERAVFYTWLSHVVYDTLVIGLVAIT
jgi:hypothetical protein